MAEAEIGQGLVEICRLTIGIARYYPVLSRQGGHPARRIALRSGQCQTADATNFNSCSELRFHCFGLINKQLWRQIYVSADYSMAQQVPDGHLRIPSHSRISLFCYE